MTSLEVEASIYMSDICIILPHVQHMFHRIHIGNLDKTLGSVSSAWHAFDVLYSSRSRMERESKNGMKGEAWHFWQLLCMIVLWWAVMMPVSVLLRVFGYLDLI